MAQDIQVTTIQVRLRADHKALIFQAAEAHGLPMSAWVRRVLLDAAMGVPKVKETWVAAVEARPKVPFPAAAVAKVEQHREYETGDVGEDPQPAKKASSTKELSKVDRLRQSRERNAK